MDEIIFGKANIEKIVCIEPKDGSLEIFYEEGPGLITSSFHQNRYWLLSSQQIDRSFVRMKGDLHYKWGKQYNNREEFQKARMYLKKYDIFSVYNAKEAVSMKDGYSCFLGMQPEDVSLLSFDIETTGLDPDAADAKILLISCAYRNKNKLVKELFCYDKYDSQKEMLEDWASWIRMHNPSILLGHNIFGFDLKYIQTVADNVSAELKLGRDGSEIEWDNYEKKFRVDGSRDLHYINCHIYGREIIDTMFLSIKADIGRKYNSYGLKPIIEQEGWLQANRVLYNAADIRKNYQNPVEWDKIKAYCEGDAMDAITLYDKFVPPFFYMCQSVAKGSFQSLIQTATGSQLNSIMCRAYLQQGHSLPKADEEAKFEGAISIGNPGIYNNCLKLDIASLYPSIMVEYGIYPAHKDPNEYFPFLVKYFREERLKNKKLAKDTGEAYYAHLEQSQKIAINSLYGFMGAPGLLFNYVEGAADVTKYGRIILNKGLDFIKSQNMQIVNADTDSIMFNYQDGQEISQITQDSIRDGMNALFPKNISWEFDGYFRKVVVLKAKNYILDDGKKVKFKGSALRSPSLEPALREFIGRVVDAILKEESNYTEIYNEYIREIKDIGTIFMMKRWGSRKTISSKTLESERTNEKRIRDAIEDTEYVEGDRCYVFFKEDGTLDLVENFHGDYNKKKLYEKLFKTGQRFSTVLNSKELFPNYGLKRNQENLKVI